MIVSLGSAGQISGREYSPDTHLSQTLVITWDGEGWLRLLLTLSKPSVEFNWQEVGISIV